MRNLTAIICLMIAVLLVHPTTSHSADKEKETVSDTMIVLDKLASELLESLNIDSKIAIRPFSKKKTGLPESISSGLINGLVSALQRKTNYKLDLVARAKLIEIWKDAEEFKSVDFNSMVAKAGADVLIIGDVRTREKGLELSFRAYDISVGNMGKIIASTRLHYAELDWKSETGFSPEQTTSSLKKIAGSLKTIQKSFSALTQLGGVIANPTRPEQFYHNARVQEQGGDYGNARRSYNRYFTFKLKFLDPHLRYQTFLKIQEGRAGAREVYSEIYENDKRPVVEFSRILLFNAPKRTEMIKIFISKNKEFSPAYYELSREFSKVRKGTQSLSDKKAELKALQEFESLRKAGKFLKYFVDKELASKWIADAETRLKALSFVSEMKKKRPVSISASKSNQAWHLRAEIMEPVLEVFYRLPPENKFKSMGHLRYMGHSGLPMAMQEFQVQSCPKNICKIEIKYIDITKTERGPFQFKVDLIQNLLEAAKDEILFPPSQWASIGKIRLDLRDGRLPMYLLAISHRCTISDIKFGIDINIPNTNIKLEDCDLNNWRTNRDKRYIQYIPPETTFVSISLIFRDGTSSKTHKLFADVKRNQKDSEKYKENSKSKQMSIKKVEQKAYKEALKKAMRVCKKYQKGSRASCIKMVMARISKLYSTQLKIWPPLTPEQSLPASSPREKPSMPDDMTALRGEKITEINGLGFITSDANLYSGAGVNSTVILTLPKGTEVQIRGQVEGRKWYLIKLTSKSDLKKNNLEGYVEGKLLARLN